MATSYPGGLDAFTNPTATDSLASASVPHATQHSNANDAIEAIEAELGVNPSGASATVVARLDALDTTVAGKAATVHTHAQSDVTNLTTDLAGKAAAVHTHAQSDVTNLTTDLAAKAPLASPTFTGVVAVPLGSAASPSIVPTGDTNTGIYSPGADQVGIATAGTAAVVANASQQVGIATSPSSRFHIGGSGAALILHDSTGNIPEHRFRRYGGTFGAPAVVANGDAIGVISAHAYDGTTTRIAASIGFNVDGAPGSSDMPGRIGFYTTADGTASETERMRIDNAGLITGTGTSLGAWTAYTPTLGGFTAGSGTPTSGSWVRLGKIVHFRAIWTYGTGSAAASARPTLTLPSASVATLGGVFQAYFFDTSAAAYYAAVPIQTSTTVVTMGVLGTNGISNAASTTSPFTWAAGDQIVLTGTYELA